MRIEYVSGNLLLGAETHMVHGCNAQGVMRSGIAAEVRDVYPEAYEEYRAEYERNGLRVGQTIWVSCEPNKPGYGPKVVINAITQEFYGREPGRLYASYEGIRAAVREINSGVMQGERIGFPLIGCGLANGSWKIVSQIIEEESTRLQPVVYLFDGKMPET